MAKFCFSLGMASYRTEIKILLELIYLQNLKRIEVIADDEAEIIEAVQRMSHNYDFVVTSGGIGPTWELLLHISR
jgi:molybdopterin biosynthesis enzyme MoaB